MTADHGTPGSDMPNEGTAVRALARAGVKQARKTASGVLNATTDVIAATKEKGEAVIDDTREKTYRAAAETNRLFQEHPIAAVAAAAAAGAVLSIFLPRVAIAAKAGQVAGRALKAAIASEAAQAVVAGLRDSQRNAVRSAASNAVTAVTERIRAKQAKVKPLEKD